MPLLWPTLQINEIKDFKGKKIGAGSITSLAAGQSQFYTMMANGVSYSADTRQVVFTNDESLLLQGLIDGDFDVAFARTDQIERLLLTAIAL